MRKVLPAIAWLYLTLTLGIAAAQTPAPSATTAEDPELAEVVIIGREPRYVAPTTRDRIGRVWVPVHIDDKGPFRLVLDSGASSSAVIASVARALDMPLDKSPPVLLRGVTGSAVAPTIRVGSVSVGDLWVGPATLPIVVEAFGGADGLLGTDGMQDLRIFIDFRNDFINIARSRNRRAANGFTTLPFLKEKARLLVVPAQVGNLPVRAIIDTGAQVSIGNGALRSALRRQVERNLSGRDEIHGATGAVQYGDGARISSITLGSLQIRDAHLTFGEMDIFAHWELGQQPALLIGMDILGLLDTLIIDYKRQELQLKPR
jgi:predicted aspartyl protease